jgi:hypothetical protein
MKVERQNNEPEGKKKRGRGRKGKPTEMRRAAEKLGLKSDDAEMQPDDLQY